MPELYSTTNLIINNIPSVISDEQLNKLFSTFGSIKSCKIIRSNEKDSKAFGFCEYNDARSAKQALSQLDNYRLNDRILKVSYAKLFPKPKGKCIEVSNLPKTTQEDAVRKYFSQFGRIARLRLLFNSNSANGNQTKTSEIVFENKVDADKASLKSVIKWNYDNGKQATVSVQLISSERSRAERDPVINKSANSNILYINSTKQLGDNHFYLQHANIDPQSVHKTAFDFSHFNSIVNCAAFTPIYQHPLQFYPAANQFNNLAIQIPPYNSYEITDKSLQSIPLQYPFAYPHYNSFVNPGSHQLPYGIPLMYSAFGSNLPLKTGFEKSANQLIHQSDYHLHGNGNANNNCNINVNSANFNSQIGSKSPAPATIGRNSYVVYVYNIGNTTTKEQLRDLFGPKFGREIVKVDVPKDSQNGSNKNFGFVTFGSFQKAQLAIDEMNGKEFQGKPLQVSFKK